MKRAMIIAVLVASLLTAIANAATVTYSGILHDDGLSIGTPTLDDNFVIAGTFQPGFNIARYNFIYGDDAGNTDGNHYARAVADGNFRPIGTGTLADAAGAFLGSGSTSTNIDGLPIYIYCFPDNDPFGIHGSGALFSGTGPSWRIVNDASTSIDAATANIFLQGFSQDGTIWISGLPMPEPQVAASSLLLTLIARRARRTAAK